MKKFKFNLQLFAEDGEPSDDTPVVDEFPTNESVESDTDESQTDVEEETIPNEYAEMLSAINSKAIYKGEPMNIESFDDVINRVQMAENYQPTHDRMVAAENEVKAFKESRMNKFMTKFLADNNFESFEEYEDALEINGLVDEGMTEERAREYVEGQRAINDKRQAKEKADKESNKEDINSKNSVEAIEWYKDSGYGDLTADKITQETWDKVNDKNIPLKYALMEQMFGNIKSDTEQEVIKKLQNKSQSSMGSLSSTNNKQTKSIADMSDAEFDKLQAEVKSGNTTRFKK